MTHFKFHSTMPTGNICAIHGTEMECLTSEPSPLLMRHIDGTVEEREVQRVIGYRHSLQGGDPADYCEYFYNDRGYTVVRHFGHLRATWMLDEGQPEWVIADPAKEETLAACRGSLCTPQPDSPADVIKDYVSHVIENGPVSWIYPPLAPAQNPYQDAVHALQRALIDAGAGVLWWGSGADLAFELNSVISALQLPVFEVNYLYGQSQAFIEACAAENDEDASETVSRSYSPGGPADWLESMSDIVRECAMVKVYGAAYAMAPMTTVMARLVPHSGLHEAIRVMVEQGEVLCAISRFGHYDPATNHEPPAGQELDVIEVKEKFRSLWDDSFPGLQGLFSEQYDPEDDE